MKKDYFMVLAALLFFLASLAIGGSLAKNVSQAQASPDTTRGAGFTVAHPALRPGGRTSVQVSVCGNAHGDLTYAWTADAGVLSASDTNPVVWTAPESEGRYRVSVEATDAAGWKSKGSAGILVSKYPANPLIMSVDPAGCKTAKQ